MKSILQFGFKHFPKPPFSDDVPVVDCRIIPNPWKRGDRATDEERRARVREDQNFEPLVAEGVKALGKADVIGVACYHGKHRSVAVAREIARRTGAKIVKLISDHESVA